MSVQGNVSKRKGLVSELTETVQEYLADVVAEKIGDDLTDTQEKANEAYTMAQAASEAADNKADRTEVTGLSEIVSNVSETATNAYNKAVNNAEAIEEINEKIADNELVKIDIVDSLDSTSPTEALSANQGRVLNEKLSSFVHVITGNQFDVGTAETGWHYTENGCELMATWKEGFESIGILNPRTYLYVELIATQAGQYRNLHIYIPYGFADRGIGDVTIPKSNRFFEINPLNGGFIDRSANSGDGGAVGVGSSTSNGFAGGKNAKTEQNINGDSILIDAVQLGTGTNPNPKTVQVYDFPLLDANGKIPSERLPDGVGDVDKSDVFIVNVTVSPLLYIDKTYNEILQAHKDGKVVQLRYDNKTYYIVSIPTDTEGDIPDGVVGIIYQIEFLSYSNGLLSYAVVDNSNAFYTYKGNPSDYVTSAELNNKADKWTVEYIDVDTEIDPGYAFIYQLIPNTEYFINNDTDTDNLTHILVEQASLGYGEYAVINFWSGTTPPMVTIDSNAHCMGKDVNEYGAFCPQPNTYYTMIFHGDKWDGGISIGGYSTV